MGVTYFLSTGLSTAGRVALTARPGRAAVFSEYPEETAGPATRHAMSP